MKKNIYLLVVLLLVAFASCKHDNEVFDGPSLSDLYGDFKIEKTLEASRDSVDFSIGQKVYFSATISKPVDWQITITGLTSGAIKTIAGKSKTIDITNSNWNGSTTVFPMFNKENCAVMLTFQAEPDTLRDTVKIIKTKVDAGFLVADFNNGKPSGYSQISTYGPYVADPPTATLPPTPTAFIQSGAAMDFKAKNTETIAEGAYYYNMAGTVNWDWAIGLIEFPASTYGLTYYPLGTNPDNVYFNVLVWGEPGISNALLQFSFREDDNGNGIFNSGSDDEAVYEIKNINWVGWKLVSIKYNGTTLSTKGNGLYNPDKIVGIRAFLLADPSSGFSKCKMDYMIFTANKPLEP